MTDIPSIQWFPGHMTKTKRMIKANLPLVDAVVEIVDARVPESSRNPDLGSLIKGKPKIIILNKCDAADVSATQKWLSWYEKQGIAAIAADCKSGKGLNRFIPAVRNVLSALIEKYEAKGMKGRTIHLMAVGIPNVGKSSFINRLAGQKKAKVEDRPGVTRDKQWVRVGEDIELLDMPGILWPKFDDMSVGEKLAFTGAVKDDVVDTETLAGRLLYILKDNYGDRIAERYKINISDDDDGFELLLKVGKARGMLMSGGEINTERASAAVLDEFRSGKLGRITLDFPPEE